MYAEPKIRECDVKYITGFEPADISNLSRDAGWRFRTPSFMRASVFAFIVVIIWLFSGIRFLPDPKQKVLEK